MTVILLHGFTHTGASWDAVRLALRERYRALAPDLRGHGLAGPARPVTLQAAVADVAALVPGKFTLCGYSMGGRLALHVALAERPRVQRLVLIGASPGIVDEAEREQRRRADERLADEIERIDIAEFAQQWGRNPLFAGQPAGVRADRLRNTTSGLARALRGFGTGALPSLWGRLGELTMPVVLVVGERDSKFRAIAERMAPLIPDCALRVVPQVGHAVHLEAPDAVARLL